MKATLAWMGLAAIGLATIGAAQAATVVVTVEGVEASKGMINVGLCDKSLSREGCPYVAEQPAKTGTVEVKFEGIPPGRYAIVGYHDLNENARFDLFLGIPQEPYALSNNAAESLVPTYDKAALMIKPQENKVTVQMRRFLGR
jgi:uncharacterized protein (DUF2141 family)